MNKKLIWVIVILGIMANLFDAVTTYIALYYPAVYESNPVMAFFFSYPFLGYSLKLILGTWIFLPLKYCPYYYARKLKPYLYVVWVALIVGFIYVGVKNILLTI